MADSGDFTRRTWNARDEIEEILARIDASNTDGQLDYSCIFDLIMLYLRKQGEIFGTSCVLGIAPKNLFYGVMEPVWKEWADRSAIFLDIFPWKKLPNGITMADHYINEMPGIATHPTLSAFFSLNRDNPERIRGNWFRYFERHICKSSLPVLKREKDKLKILFEFSQEIWVRMCRLKYPEFV